MNYSKRTKRRIKVVLITSHSLVAVIGILIGVGLALLLTSAGSVETVSAKPLVMEEMVIEDVVEIDAEVIEPELTYLGEYTITAYCSCEKCCGVWAKDRPNGIVYGAAGIELAEGVSVASTLPFGTQIIIDGVGQYIVQDRTASWIAEKYDNKIIDIYFENHEDALNFGKQYHEIYILNERNDEDEN